MSAGEPKIICITPAPAPNPDPNPEETLHIRKGGASKTFKVIAGILAFALIAGIVVAVAVSRGVGGGAASASVETAAVTDGSGNEAAEGSDGDVATATDSDAQHPACAGEIADPQTRWYCQEFLPFANKAVADHHRIDRLEAAGKGSGSGTPLNLWIVVIVIGVLTVFNTVKILSKKAPSQE